jgi:hypothetical protein
VIEVRVVETGSPIAAITVDDADSGVARRDSPARRPPRRHTFTLTTATP